MAFNQFIQAVIKAARQHKNYGKTASLTAALPEGLEDEYHIAYGSDHVLHLQFFSDKALYHIDVISI